MLNVLIVDDDMNVSHCLKNLIPWEDLGYGTVADASNGAEALPLLTTLRPNVVITDLKMPVMDGIEFCKRIRCLSDETVIIFLSAYESFSAAQIALRCNVTEYILKPINHLKIDQLTTLLQDLSRHYQNRNFFHNILNNDNLAQEMVHRIHCRDTAYFSNFFLGFSDCTISDFTTVQEASLKLVNILFDCLQELGIQAELVSQRKSKTMQELSRLQRKMDMVTYVSKLFSDVLQFSHPKNENYYVIMMEKIKNYLEENLSNPTLGVASIADKFGFSTDYVGKIFIKYVGVSINGYLLKLRLNQAVNLLTSSRLPINEISTKCGYTSLNYFSRVFRKQYGNTPSEYRNSSQSLAFSTNIKKE